MDANNKKESGAVILFFSWSEQKRIKHCYKIAV